jgi:fatty-acyl-CoA synthase
MSITSTGLDPLVHPDRQRWRPTDEPARLTSGATLGQALVERFRIEPDAVAYYLEEETAPVRLTVGELHHRAQAAAGALAAAGTRAGDRVCLCLDTSVDLLAALFGVALLGAVPFLVEPPLTAGRRHV